MAQASRIVQEEEGVQFIDINMGCPVKKVVKKGAGAALLQDTRQLGRFFASIKKALQIPLSIKIRTGWDENSINASQVISIAHSEGVEFVAVHGRTRKQAYTGKADWPLLEALAQDSPLPLIGNGDLHCPQKISLPTSFHPLSGLDVGERAFAQPLYFCGELFKG